MPRRAERIPAILALEDGSVFRGLSFGARGDAAGEAVFNTGMTGYQEILTDPSYRGQMVAMTVPHVGNYGLNPDDAESERPHVEAFIVREACAVPSNWRSREGLPEYLERHGIPGIEGIDTRALVLLLREKGTLRAVLSTGEKRAHVLVDRARAVPPIEERDLVPAVTCTRSYEWEEPEGGGRRNGGSARPGFSVVVVDCGVKRNILRSLAVRGCRVTVVPAFAKAGEVLSLNPDGVLFSNGPGDPGRLPSVSAALGALIGRVPVFGICLGHQLMARALGGRTYRLKFGHHGGNQPVMRLASGSVAITVQNHNFAVAADSLPPDVEVTHLNLNDRTVEGQAHRSLPLSSVQFHPEAAPGPHDATDVFDSFLAMMAGTRGS